MNRAQEELQFLGFYGIMKEAFNIIFTWRKIFSKITLALILPLSFLFLAHIQLSQLFFTKATHNHQDTPKDDVHNVSDMFSSKWIMFWVLKVAYFIFLLVLSLLATAAVVYTIACVYTSKTITFKKVMSVVPKVWKKLVVTFLWSFGIVFVYNVIATVFFILLDVLVGINQVVGIAILVFFLVLYSAGLLYITIIWHLASVVSVLEEIYGLKALKKGKNLIKGNMGVGVEIFVLLGICYLGIQFLFEYLVVFGSPSSLGVRIGIGILCFLFLFKVILFELVMQTVLYFVCKSYHHENIDKSSLSEHLDVFDWDYVHFGGRKDVQMEQLQV